MKDALQDLMQSEFGGGTRRALTISYDADIDFLLALEPGEVIDGQLEEDTDEIEEGVWLFRRASDGRLIGFGVDDLYELEPPEGEGPLWEEPRFDVPTLALQNASMGEIVLAARATLDSQSTPDVIFFDAAVEAQHEDAELAESLWRACLAAGDMKGHFGLGYTLCDLGRHREAYGHLRMYCEITPNNPWAWVWLGMACEAMGEHGEAKRAFRRALEAEQRTEWETDAQERLDALEEGGS